MKLIDLLTTLKGLIDNNPDLEPKTISKTLESGLKSIIDKIENEIKQAGVNRPLREKLVEFTDLTEDALKEHLSNFNFDQLVKFCDANGIKTTAKTKETKITGYKKGILKKVKELRKKLG